MGYFSQDKAGQSKTGLNGTGSTAKQGDEAPVRKNVTNVGNGVTGTVSTLGPGMLITGNIVCEGSAHIFGRVIGDIQAVEIVIGEGARVEGNITAQEVGILGALKGTIRRTTVRLKGSATVDGEVFSKSLTVEENVLFEGLSRRLDKPVELQTCAQAAGEQPAPAASSSVSEIVV